MVAKYDLGDEQVRKILEQENGNCKSVPISMEITARSRTCVGKVVILIDDGIATGTTLLTAVRALRVGEPAKIVVAAPVSSIAGCELLQNSADEVICPFRPRAFESVGRWYREFSPVKDTEVLGMLRQYRAGPKRS